MIILFVVSIIAFSLSAQAAVKDPVYDDFEGLDLVEALIRDGRLDSAESELRNFKTSERRIKLMGDIAYARQDFKTALENYSRLPLTPMYRLLKGRASAQLQRSEQCVENFHLSGDLWLNSENDVTLKATCEFRVKLFAESFATLLAGSKRHPTYGLQRERVSLLLELALSQSALTAALERAQECTSSELLGLAELFHNKKMNRETLILLELGRTRFPLDVDVNLSIAKAYFTKGDLRATAEAFEQAARLDRKFAYHAAEIRRQIGHKQIAAYWLPLISDEKEKLRARLAGYVDSNSYPLIASMESVLRISALNQDDEVRYALGYSLYRQGEIEKPLKYLSQIRSPHHLERAALLRKSILEARP